MGDIGHYLEILIFIGLFLVTVATLRNPFKEMFGDEEDNLYPIPRVVNGHKADLAQFPYQIAFKKLLEMDWFGTYCGGALIGRQKIISAAHCFVMDANWCERNIGGNKRVIRLDNRYAVAGTIKNQETKYRSYRQQWRSIAKAKIPSTFAYPIDDIAVLITVNPFMLDEFVNVIPIAMVTRDYTEIRCNVTGYGKTTLSKFSQFLMWATLHLINATDCTEMHGMDMDRFICTRSDFTDVMEGDSGGPLVCRDTGDPNESRKFGVVVGVVSGTRKPGGTFFTRVPSYYNYIQHSNASISTINLICLCILIPYYIKLIL